MSVHVTIQKQIESPDLPSEKALRRFINAAYLSTNQTTEVTLRIVDEVESQDLNFEYRQKKRPTNVLAFPYEMPEYLGDLVVCEPIVVKEAKAQGKSILAHWAHLLVHGTLHLQGYDHIKKDDQHTMEALEIKILKQLNFPNPYEEEQTHE